DLPARDVLGGGARAARAGLVAGPFFNRVDEQAGVTQRFRVRFDWLVEGPGVLIGRSARVRDDRRFTRDEISIDAAKLNLLLLVPAPACLLRSAKAGMH